MPRRKSRAEFLAPIAGASGAGSSAGACSASGARFASGAGSAAGAEPAAGARSASGAGTAAGARSASGAGTAAGARSASAARPAPAFPAANEIEIRRDKSPEPYKKQKAANPSFSRGTTPDPGMDTEREQSTQPMAPAFNLQTSAGRRSLQNQIFSILEDIDWKPSNEQIDEFDQCQSTVVELGKTLKELLADLSDDGTGRVTVNREKLAQHCRQVRQVPASVQCLMTSMLTDDKRKVDKIKQEYQNLVQNTGDVSEAGGVQEEMEEVAGEQNSGGFMQEEMEVVEEGQNSRGRSTNDTPQKRGPGRPRGRRGGRVGQTEKGVTYCIALYQALCIKERHVTLDVCGRNSQSCRRKRELQRFVPER